MYLPKLSNIYDMLKHSECFKLKYLLLCILNPVSIALKHIYKQDSKFLSNVFDFLIVNV